MTNIILPRLVFGNCLSLFTATKASEFFVRDDTITDLEGICRNEDGGSRRSLNVCMGFGLIKYHYVGGLVIF